MVYLETKNDIIQFSPNAIKSTNHWDLFQKRYQEEDDFQKILRNVGPMHLD